MQATNTTRQARLAWAAAFNDSLLTAQAYAKQAGLSVATLHYWHKKIATAASPPTPGFTSVVLTPSAPTGQLHLRLPGGVEIHGPAEALVHFAQKLVDRA